MFFLEPKEGEKSFAPKILEKVSSLIANDGSQVEFTCKIEGSPRPQITWFRQTAIIKPSQDFQIYYADDNIATLVIKEVFPEDAGTFTCVAKNCIGYASSSADLTVQKPLSDHGIEKHDRRSLSRESSLADIVEGIPPTFAQRPQTKTVDEGAMAELECRFVAIPEADVVWVHNKKELKESDRVKVIYQADMHMYCSIVKISNVSMEDAGTYEVLAKNREGEATNNLILKVTPKTEMKQDAPMIVKALTATVCNIGDAIKMEAVITGTPKPEVSWYYNDKELSKSDNVTIAEKDNIYSISISKTSTSNEGEYMIKAKNEFGSVQTCANLCVQGESVNFIKKLEDIEVKETGNIQMTVEVSSENSQVKWEKDGIEIKTDDGKYEFKSDGRKHSIIIKSSTVHHEGEYVASVGEQECSCEVTVMELPPEFNKSLSDTTVTANETAIFEIELSKGDAVTKWFKNGTEIEFSAHFVLRIDGKKQKLEIVNTNKEDAGEYSCTVGDKTCKANLIVEEPKVNFVKSLDKITSGTFDQDVLLQVELSADINVVWHK